MSTVSKPRKQFDCSKCTAYCCSYDHIEVNDRDIARLARHFSLSEAVARERFTKVVEDDVHVLRHRKDHIFKSVCIFLDRKKRCCTVYEARPGLCKVYPYGTRCGYYEFLSFEREHADDETMIP